MDSAPAVETAAARLVTELTFATIPDAAVEAARRLMEDQLAMQIGSAALPWSQAILDLTRMSHGPGNAHVTAAGDAMSAADAAFVNATFGHGFEYDDAHRASSAHPGSCVVSAALAVGEEVGASMQDVVTALIAGYETYTRIGVLAAPEMLERGFHPHCVLSNFGAAAVVAKLRGFDIDTTVNALGIALSHASGTTEYSSSGGSIKRVHSGIGTRNGIRAAEMAAAGITGPSAFLTGSKGFFRVMCGRPAGDGAEAAFELSAPFEVTRQWIKPYCCCGIIHAYVDGARQLTGGVDDVDSVVLGIQTGGDVVVGNQNVNAYRPLTIEHLQYSLPFQFSLSMLGRGNGFATHRDYMAGRLDIGDDSDVAQLARKIRIIVTPELDAEYPGRWVADIAASYTDGSRQEVFIDNPVGTAENPMSIEDLDAKFHEVTTTAISREHSERLLNVILHGDLQRPVSDFTELLRVP